MPDKNGQFSRKELLAALDDAYILWQKHNRQIGSNTGEALMDLGRMVCGKKELPTCDLPDA